MTSRPRRPVRLAQAVDTPDARVLTDVVTRLRRALRTSIRTDYPWETLPMAQVEILQRLSEEPGLRLNDVALRQHLATNTVSVVVQRLVEAGLVSRSVDEYDRRAIRLSVSALGEQVLEDWRRAHERRFAMALQQLDATERSAIAGAMPALAKLVDHLNAMNPGSGGQTLDDIGGSGPHESVATV